MGQQHAALLIYDKWMGNDGMGKGREARMDNGPQRRDNEQRRMGNDKDNANDSAVDNENDNGNDNGNDNDNGNESAQRIMRCPITMTIASCDCRLPIADLRCFQITQNTWPQPEAEANVSTCATGQTRE